MVEPSPDWWHRLVPKMWISVTTLADAKRPDPATPTRQQRTTFASLRTRNFRLFATGQVVSNTGTWVLRIAQDWLVLGLTGSTVAVGVTTALQFLPTVLLGMAGGLVADRYPKRRILLWCYGAMAFMAAALAGLTLSDQVQAWHIQLTAVGLGIVAAVEYPARQTFVNEMVGTAQLRNAISINSAVFQLGGLIGPAASGLLIGAVGPGWAFLITAISFTAPVVTLRRIRGDDLRPLPTAPRQRRQLRAGLRYVANRPDILWPTVLVGVFAMFTANLPVTLAAYAKTIFHTGPAGYGLLSAAVAIGSITGALVSARQPHTRLRVLLALAAALSVLYVLAAAAPTQLTFCALLLAIGATTMLLLTAANSTVQLAAPDTIRGRVMGIYLLAFVAGAALGGPLLGSIDQHLGPHAGMLVTGILPGLATVLIAARLGMYLRRQNRVPVPPLSAAPR